MSVTFSEVEISSTDPQPGTKLCESVYPRARNAVDMPFLWRFTVLVAYPTPRKALLGYERCSRVATMP